VLWCSFAKTEALLREEAGVDSMALSAQRLQVNGNGIIENMLYSLADQDPTQYADSFQKLASWVDSSLDLYKVRYGTTTVSAWLHICLQPWL
jgi:hypothetical protein